MSLPFSFKTSYPTPRRPVFARNIVSTSHPLGAQAGLRMMANGGNAVDAAIAAAAVMTIVEPCSNGLGSDCVLHPVGRPPAARAQRVRAGARRVDAAVLPRQARCRGRHAAGARLGFGERARRGGVVGRDEREVRQAAVRRPAGAGDRHRRARLCGAGDRAAQVAACAHGEGADLAARVRRGVPAEGPHSRSRRADAHAGRREGLARDRADQGRGVLPRRDRAGDRAPRQGTRRCDARLGPRGLQARVGRADRHRLPRLPLARDAAQRAGHRGADRARHPRALRHRRDRSRQRGLAAPADRGDEAGLRRHLPLRGGAAHDDRHAGADARPRLPEAARAPDRPQARAAVQCRHTAQGRHDLPHRGRRARHDGELHPEQLHGLRLRRGGAGVRHQPAEPRPRLFARCAEPQRRRPGQAAVPDHHSGVPHEGRPAADELWRDGRQHAAAGPSANAGAHARPRAGSAGRVRCAALALRRRHERGGGAGDEARHRAGPDRAGPSHRAALRHLHGPRLRPVHLAPRRSGQRRATSRPATRGATAWLPASSARMQHAGHRPRARRPMSSMC